MKQAVPPTVVVGGLTIQPMYRPKAAKGCPPGLEWLHPLNQLFIKQKIEVLEVITGIETENKYMVLNPSGQLIYFVLEQSGCCRRQCCDAQRPFELQVLDFTGAQVMHIRRPYKCECCHQICSCSSCCKDEVSVEAPPGYIIGRVKQAWDKCQPLYHIKNEQGNTVLIVQGPNYCQCHCSKTQTPFDVLSPDGMTQVGCISKQWSNLVHEILTGADIFGLTFPMDMCVKSKAVTLAACFLINFMFFENNEVAVATTE